MNDRSPRTSRGSTDGENKSRRPVRDRILDAAYDLFSLHGIVQVGIDAIIAKSGCAKASLYNQFGSKEGLALAFLDMHELRWTRDWLETEIMRRADTPEGRLLAVFPLFGEWFAREDFRGCVFINVLLEFPQGSPVRRAAGAQLAKTRDILRGQAGAIGLVEVDDFSEAWHMLMTGSVLSAVEGHRDAARPALRNAEILLANWPRETPTIQR